MSDLTEIVINAKLMRATTTVNMRSEASAMASREATLQMDALVWADEQLGEFTEVWLHGWVATKYLTAVEK